MSGGVAGLAWQVFSMFTTTALTIGLPMLAAGALIGGIIGAVNGYSQAGQKITEAESAIKREAQQEAVERQQTQKLLQQQQDMETQYAAQTQQFQGGGQLSPGGTPDMSNNNNLVNNKAPQIG